MTPSIGIIETKSIAASAEILNRILKSSNVELINIEYPGNGSLTVFLSGEYSQMKNSLATAEKISSEFQIQLISRIITKPDDKLFGLIGIHNEIPVKIKSASVLEIKERENKIDEEKFIETSPISEKNQEALEAVNVIEKQENAQPIKGFAKRIMVETVKEKKKAVNKDKLAGVTDSDAIPIKVRTDNPTIAKLRMEALGKKTYVEPESEIKLVAESQNGNGPLSLEQLQGLNVHKLRRYARNFSSFPIKGREISRANRDELLNYFKELL